MLQIVLIGLLAMCLIITFELKRLMLSGSTNWSVIDE